MTDRLWEWLMRLFSPRCPHIWRPARTSRGPARYCDLCEETQPLSEEMFYAYFGRISR